MLAHESWFTDLQAPYRLEFLLDPLTLGVIAIAILAAATWRIVGRKLRSPVIGALRPLGGLSPYIPRLLGIHAGVSLLAQSARGTFLSPALVLPENPFGAAVAIVEGIVGVWLITGYRLRWPSAALVASGAVGMLFYGFVPVAERVDLLGIALFLALRPPSDEPAGAASTAPSQVRPAFFALRLLVGGSLVVLSFTEKLARPELALAFLNKYPAFNIFQAVGFEVPDLIFVRIAGAVELCFGLLIMSGAMPQLTVLLAGIPFNATLFFLGAPELIGHLPLYGAMLAMLVYGSDDRLAEITSWLPGVRRPAPPPRFPASRSG